MSDNEIKQYCMCMIKPHFYPGALILFLFILIWF